MSEKDFWPDLIGYVVEEAKEIISNDRPDLKFVIVPEGSTQPRALKLTRVILYVDRENKLTRPPRVG